MNPVTPPADLAPSSDHQPVHVDASLSVADIPAADSPIGVGVALHSTAASHPPVAVSFSDVDVVLSAVSTSPSSPDTNQAASAPSSPAASQLSTVPQVFTEHPSTSGVTSASHSQTTELLPTANLALPPQTHTVSAATVQNANTASIGAHIQPVVDERVVINPVSPLSVDAVQNREPATNAAASFSIPTSAVSSTETLITPESNAQRAQDADEKSFGVMLTTMSEMLSKFQYMMESMSPDRTGRHNVKLNQLHDALESCAATLSSSSEATQSPEESQVVVKEPKSYLDLLPMGPTENILRFFSNRPRSPEWPKYISVADAEMLFLNDGLMGDAFRRMFNDVELQTELGMTRSGEIALSTRDVRSRTNEVIERAGSTFKKLMFTGDRNPNSPPHMTSWIEPFKLHCTNVVHLTLHRVHAIYVEQILGARSGELESLNLDLFTSSRTQMNVVATHCRGLKSLTFCPSLNVPESLWQSIGESLVELDISHLSKEPITKDISKHIQEYCRALRKISWHNRCGCIELVDLLKSYGEQLEYAKANFSKLPFDQVTAIAATCPNATFALSSIVKLDTIMALRYRVPSLKFSKPPFDVTPPNFFEDYKTIRCLTMSMNDADSGWFLSELLREPKLELTEICVTYALENPTEVLSLIANNLSKLTKLKLWSNELPSPDTLAPVLRANTQLKKLSFKARRPHLSDVRRVLNVVADSCESLRELRISKLPSPAPPPLSPHSDVIGSTTAFEIKETYDACLPFRRINTYVQILNVDYVI